MKTGLTIQQMAQELLRQSKAKQDYLVNTGSLSLSVTTDAPQLRVTENGLDTFRRQEQRRQSHEFSYQAAHPPPDDAFDALRARLLLHDLFLLADKEQALLIRHRLHGCSLAETARREGVSVKRVRHRLKALYRAYFTQKENKQKEL